MAFSIPSLSDFVRIAENGLSSEFYGEASVLRKSVLKVIARVFAGIAYLLALFLRKMWKNAFIHSCDVETLDDFGVDFDLPNKPESYAKGQVMVTKTTSSNVAISQGTVIADESGNEFEVDADYTLSGSANSVFMVKVLAVQSGDSGNIDAGTVLAFRDGAPSGLEDDVVVDAEGISGGVKIEVLVNGNVEYWGETVERYRNRLLDYRRNQPSGGDDADYKSWAERFPSVTKCIVQPNYPVANAVTCVLAYYGEESDSIAVNTTNVNEVRDYIQSDVRRPITADVRVVSCVPKDIDFVIRISPNNMNVQASVQSALRKILESYVPGDTLTKNDFSIKLVGASSADNVYVVSVNSSDSVFLSKPDHELPVIHSVTWVD